MKRYRMDAQAEFGQDAWAIEVEDGRGQFVRYADHEAEIARLTAALAQSRAETQAAMRAEINEFNARRLK